MKKTLRLIYPDWAAGRFPEYVFGARLLDFLAPEGTNMVRAEVPVDMDFTTPLVEEEGIIARSASKKNLQNAVRIIEENQPDRIVTFGGNCLVSQAPMDYLNGKYKDSFGLLWMDSHPDCSDPSFYNIENAMVLGNLIGQGDPDFAKEVKNILKPTQVLYAGLKKEQLLTEEKRIIDCNHIQIIEPQELVKEPEKILEWMEIQKVRHIGIHLDVDVLNPAWFHAQLPANPKKNEMEISEFVGELNLDQVGEVIARASEKAELVGLSISEHTPWDAINLHNFMKKLSIFN